MGIRSLIQRLFPKEVEKRKAGESGNVNDPVYWQNFFSQFGLSAAGQNVTVDSAMRLSTVYACVRVLAETIASLPLCIYKRTKKEHGRELADTHPLYFLLHDMPNPYQTSFEFREMLMGHLCLRGNAYCEIFWNEAGEIDSLYPLNPARMQIIVNNRIPYYIYTDDKGNQSIYEEKKIWHIRGLSSDGVVGYSPITLAREAIGFGMAVEEYGAKFFTNYARPGGILEYPGKLDDNIFEKIKKEWTESYTGKNAHRTAILEGGLSYKQIGINNVDAQFLELRQFQVEDIARIFRVPTILIGHTGDKLNTFASAEQQMLSFVTHTIRPWTSRFEQSITKDLFAGSLERRRYFAEFNLADFVRGDLKARYDAYKSGREGGWLSINDVRKLENMNPIEDRYADDYMIPKNMGMLSNIERELLSKVALDNNERKNNADAKAE